MTILGRDRARVDSHLRLILGHRVSNSGVKIAFSGRAVAGLGGTIAVVGAPIMLVAFTRRRHQAL